MTNAIIREKQLKARVRKYKIALIESKNFEWEDLYKVAARSSRACIILR